MAIVEFLNEEDSRKSMNETAKQYIESAEVLRKRITELKKSNNNTDVQSRIAMLGYAYRQCLYTARRLKKYYDR